MQKHWRPWEMENSDLSHNAPDALANRLRLTLSLQIQRASTNSEVRCEFCDIGFKRESELKRHKSTVHIRKSQHCHFCRKVFTRKDNLTRHLKLAHSDDSKPSCKFCFKPLSRKDAVQRHETTCSKNSGKSVDPYKLSHLQRLNMKLEKSKRNSGEAPVKIVQNKNEV